MRCVLERLIEARHDMHGVKIDKSSDATDNKKRDKRNDKPLARATSRMIGVIL